MLKRGVKLFTIIISFIIVFTITDSVHAKNGNRNDGNNHQMKRVLVKYRDKNLQGEENFKKMKGKQSLMKYKKVNKKNLYSIELGDRELATLLQDSDIELVEEDSIVQLLCSEHQTDLICSDMNHDIQVHNEYSEEETEHILKDQVPLEEYSLEGLCILCGQEACKDDEECMDIAHYICNDCIRDMLGDIPLADMTKNNNDVVCTCDYEDAECTCTCHDLCTDVECLTACLCECKVVDDTEDFWKDYVPCCDTCSPECVAGPCCDQCIYGDIYYQRYEIFENETTNEPVRELEVGYESIYSPLGDKINWNILRTKSNLLHDNNIKGSGIKVAVFDTGINLNHKELNVVGGISFVEGVDSYDDDNGHGTAMAGVLAAKLNGQGIVGIAPDVDLYSVKVLNKDGMGRYSNIIQGIEWAMENGINIISLSLGSNQYSQILEEAINLAIDNNILIVAAAGNGGVSNIMYPAAYPQVICVGATNSTNTLASFSNYGFQLDLVAPGASIVTTGPNNTEVTVDGTSPATQHVAGIAALLWSADKNLSNGHIKYLIYKNAHDLGEYDHYGHGLPDAELSLRNLESKDYSIYIDNIGEGTYTEGLVDVGWDGVVYVQACKHNIVQMAYTAPTCTKEGYLARGCNKCGFMEYAGSLPKLGHNNSIIVIPATCTSSGSRETRCTRCGYISGRTSIAALGHSINANTTPPTCTSAGKTVVTCMRSGCSYKKTNVLNAMGHNWVHQSTTPAKCLTNGSENYRCTRCGSTKSDSIPYPGHSMNLKKYYPTCTSKGYTLNSCSNCSYSYKSNYIDELGHEWNYDNKSPTCTEGGYSLKECSRCSEYTLTVYDKLGHNITSSVSPTHQSKGHYWSTGCTRCSYGSGSGYKTLSNCLSCTTAPSISFANMSGNTVLSEADTNFKPQIKVFDNENDTLTCKYHLDGSSTATGTMTVTGTKPEKTVTFTTGFNATNLSEGKHTIKATAKDPIAPMGETTISFKVDKSAPTISNLVVTPSTNNIKLTVTASDSISGLAPTAYRYTLNGVATGWLATDTYTKAELVPNTAYSYIVEVRDNKGHIATKTGTFNTKVEKPLVTSTALHDNSLQIVVTDNNPSSTQYRIKVGSGYVNASGVIIASESWITIPYDANVNGKRIVLSNLPANTSYTITASARNTGATEIVVSNSVSAVTSPAAPINISATLITHEHISLQWQTAAGAVQYEVYRETLNEQGNVIDNLGKIVSTNYLYDNKVSPNQVYQYKIRSVNQAGIHGRWSSPNLNIKTLPIPPAKVEGVMATSNGAELEITWDKIDEAIGYKVEIAFDGSIENLYSEDNQIVYDTNTFDCQSTIKVKAFNQYKEDEPKNPEYWTNEGEWSDSITLYTQADIPVMQSITQEQITPKSITVSWNVNNNPDSVRYLLNILQNELSIREIQVTGASITDNIVSYQVTGLLPETSYAFSVKAINSVGEDTESSNQVEAATLMEYPGIPERLRATAKSDIITLTWDAPAHAQGYQIEKNYNVIETNWLETYYVDSNVEPNTSYDYRVKAINATGESDWSQSLLKDTLGRLPSAPSVHIVTGSAISVTIEWSSSEDVSGYEIDADGHIYNMGMSTRFEHNGLTPGTVHAYAVRSRSINGKSEWSDYVTFKTKPLIPDIPIISEVIATENQVIIYWNTVKDSLYYEVEVDGIVVGATPSLGYQYGLLDTSHETYHITRIRAVNESGSGNWSATYQIKLLEDGEGGNIPIAPIPVTPNIACSVTGSAIIMIDWEPVQGATYYQLEADNSIIYTGGETRYIHAGLPPNSQHQYRIRAGNLSGESQWSEMITAYVGTPYSMAPSNISYYRIDDEATKIIWDQVAGISEYVIEVNGVVSGSAITVTNTTINTEPGTLYNIRVASLRVEDGEKNYEWSEEITFRTSRRLPEILDNIIAEASPDTITLSWEVVLGAQGYEVDSPDGIINVSNNLSYVISGLEASATYSLKVRAYNEAGHGEWSKAINVMTKEEIPGVPTNIRYSSYQSVDTVTGSAIYMQWQGVEGASSYEVEDMDGRIYRTDTNDIIVGGLKAGYTYQLRVRAVTNESAGAWSSRISVIPVIEVPNNVEVVIEADKVKVSWDPVSIDDIYEIEIDGVIVEATDNLSYEFDYQTFYMQRRIRVRALRDDTAGDWSKAVEFADQLPVTVNSYIGETFSVILPATGVEIGKYKLTLTYNQDEVELIDACDMTVVAEVSSSYIEELDIYIIIERDGTTESITYLVGEETGLSYSGIVNILKLRSKVTGDITLYYGVTLR